MTEDEIRRERAWRAYLLKDARRIADEKRGRAALAAYELREADARWRTANAAAVEAERRAAGMAANFKHRYGPLPKG
jgi:hypothetical protein